MCGIGGIINKLSVIDNSIVEKLSSSLKHRGPDGDGVWFNKSRSGCLIHRRLSILDLSDAGHQPMQRKNSPYVLVFNGEIFNFIEIKKDLLSKGYKFASDSDSEVILAAYEEYKENCFNLFNGMWALAIFNEQTNSLILSRDRFGVKPLYYYLDENHFIFSSEVQSIYKALNGKINFDVEVLSDLARGSFDWHGTDKTYLKNVHSLPGGFYAKFEKHKLEIQEWYKLNKADVPSNFNDQSQFLRELIIDACRIRMRSDVPIATCLSGGVDSGSISSVISLLEKTEGFQRQGGFSHKAYCASFPNTPIDEVDKARIIAKKIGAELRVLEVTPPSVNQLEQALKQTDGPMHSLAFYPIWALYKMIHEDGIKVTLDGQGPDEMLGGYRPLSEALKAARQKLNFPWYWDVYKVYGAMGESSQFSSRDFAQKTLLRDIKNSVTSFTNGWNEPNTISQLTMVRSQNPFKNALNKSLYRQFFQSPLPGILQQYDRCSMSNSIECRMPFMDFRVVEFIFSLPVESKVGDGYTKRVLRSAMRGIAPDSTLNDKIKIGFNAPIVDWFKNDLKDWMLEQMNTTSFLQSEYFNGKAYLNSFNHFIKDSNGDWNKAWSFWGPVHVNWTLNNIKN